MSATQSFDFQTEYSRQNATVVLNPAIHRGETVTVSVKPIMSVDSTVDFVVPASLTIAQFHRLLIQILRDDEIFANTYRPSFSNGFELVSVAQTPAPYNGHIYVENPSEWEGRNASEFAPPIIPTCQYPMGDYAGESFYIRFCQNYSYDEELEEGEIYESHIQSVSASNINQSVFIDLTNDDDDIENNADYAMTIDEMMIPNTI